MSKKILLIIVLALSLGHISPASSLEKPRSLESSVKIIEFQAKMQYRNTVHSIYHFTPKNSRLLQNKLTCFVTQLYQPGPLTSIFGNLATAVASLDEKFKPSQVEAMRKCGFTKKNPLLSMQQKPVQPTKLDKILTKALGSPHASKPNPVAKVVKSHKRFGLVAIISASQPLTKKSTISDPAISGIQYLITFD